MVGKVSNDWKLCADGFSNDWKNALENFQRLEKRITFFPTIGNGGLRHFVKTELDCGGAGGQSR
jgi:hypothetical protein